jgi:hypothetical protein
MAAPRGPAPSYDVLRAALVRARERGESLRTLGNTLGLSAAGVLKLVNGSRPRAETHRKLLEWYAGQPPLEGEPSWSAAEPMLARLLAGLTDEARSRAIAAFARAAEDEYGRARTPAPAWVAHGRRLRP